MDEKSGRYAKEDLIKSKRYQHRRDLLDAILEDGKTYTIQEVDNKIDKFMKGKVE